MCVAGCHHGVVSIVTGDAVPLQMPLAQFPTRLLALALDLVIIFITLGVVSSMMSIATQDAAEGFQVAASLLTVVLILIGMPAVIETLTRGQSAGKKAAGLRVVRTDGGPVRFRHSLTRSLALFFIDLWTTSGLVGTVTCVSTKKSQRVGDLLAGTLVVRERVPRAATVVERPAIMPPELAGWASTLDLATMPDSLAAVTRSFLGRWHDFEPQARHQMAAQLTTAVMAHSSPPPPPATAPSYYLSAVMAERSRRAWLAAAPPPTGMPPRAPLSALPPPAPGSAIQPPATPADANPRDGGFVPPA